MNSQIDINRVSIKQTSYFCDNFVFTFIQIILVICSCIDVDRLWISYIGIDRLWKSYIGKDKLWILYNNGSRQKKPFACFGVSTDKNVKL